MVPGTKRKYEEGVTLMNGDVKLRIFPDCITISANNYGGMGILNTFGIVERYTRDAKNVHLSRDGIGEVYMLEVYFKGVE